MGTIYTARYSYRGPDRVDTTRYHKGADTWGIAFAPPRWLLDVAKGYAGALARLPRGVEPPPDDDAGRWDWYAQHYRAAMLAGYGTRSTPGPHRAAWERLLSMPEATVVCFCGARDGCHRGLLAGYVERLGATHGGERRR